MQKTVTELAKNYRQNAVAESTEMSQRENIVLILDRLPKEPVIASVWKTLPYMQLATASVKKFWALGVPQPVG
jgi:hypothetical protein